MYLFLHCTMTVRVFFKLRGVKEHFVAHFTYDAHHPGTVSVATVRDHVATHFKMPLHKTFLYHVDGETQYETDTSRIDAEAKVIVRTTSTLTAPITLGDVSIVVKPCVVHVQDGSIVGGGSGVANDDDDDDMFGGDVFEDRERASLLDAEMRMVADFSRSDAKIHTNAAVATRAEGRRQQTAPPGRRCNKCAGYGHWLRDCPANDDPSLETRRLRMPCGIPVGNLRPGAGGSLVSSDGVVCSMEPIAGAFQAATEAYRPRADARVDVRAAFQRFDQCIAAGEMSMLARLPLAFQHREPMSLAVFELMWLHAGGQHWRLSA